MTLFDVYLIDISSDGSGRCSTLYLHETGMCWGTKMPFKTFEAFRELQDLLQDNQFSEDELAKIDLRKEINACHKQFAYRGDPVQRYPG